MIQAVILAGGIGSRLRPLTTILPKPMITIGGKPFLQHQIDLLKASGINKLLICVGYKAEMIRSFFGNGSRFGVTLDYSVEEKLLGTGGALMRAKSMLDDRFLLIYGDCYLPMDFRSVIKFFESHDRLGVMVVYKNNNRYDRSNVVVKEGYVTLYDKEKQVPEMVYIDYGASVLRKEALELASGFGKFDLGFLFNRMIRRRELLAYESKERFYEIGSSSGLEDLVFYLVSNRNYMR